PRRDPQAPPAAELELEAVVDHAATELDERQRLERSWDSRPPRAARPRPHAALAPQLRRPPQQRARIDARPGGERLRALPAAPPGGDSPRPLSPRLPHTHLLLGGAPSQLYRRASGTRFTERIPLFPFRCRRFHSSHTT